MVCAYCGSKSKLSREHVIPNWFLKITENEKGRTFNERAPQKFVKDIVVKDVCEVCNNGALSDLDNYGKSLFERHFFDFVYQGETVKFEYDFQKLVKWLIKCSYNSNRANTKAATILKTYAKFLISDLPLPEGVIVFCSLSAPTILENGNTIRQANRDEAESCLKPLWFRVGNFRLSENFDQNYCLRSVVINSYSFFIALPEYLGNDLNLRRTIYSRMNSTKTVGIQLKRTGEAIVGPPVQDAYNSMAVHLSNNPIAYKLKPYSQIDPSELTVGEPLTLIITRAHIEAENFEEILLDLLTIVSVREITKRFIGKVDIMISGYDEDERPLWKIKEVVKFISRLNIVFPYWLLILKYKSEWLKVLITSLCCSNKKSIGNELVIEQKLIIRNLETWFLALNEICDSFCFEEEIVQEASKELTEYVTSMQQTGVVRL